ncbi:MAG TPA: hypothetical protein VK966_03690 [Longimicrobiales bacterium]|nr:hypothetical protein [Longimicrobiales bacterium]
MFRHGLSHSGLCRLLTDIEREVSRVDSALNDPRSEREQLNLEREALRDLSSAVIRLGYVRNLRMPHPRGRPAPEADHSAAGMLFELDSETLGSRVVRDPMPGPRRPAPGPRTRPG